MKPKKPPPSAAPERSKAFQIALASLNEITAHTLSPWTCQHETTRSVVEAYVAPSGRRQRVAEVYEDAGIDAEVTAEFIARAVNDHGRNRALIRDLASVLEYCLSCDLPWEAELKAGAVLDKVRAVVGEN